MDIKWISLLLGIVVVVAFVRLLAIVLNRKDVKKQEQKVDVRVGKETLDTIQEAKKIIVDTENNGGMLMMDTKNNHSLGELLALEPKEEDYKEFIKLAGTRVTDLYEDYQFMLYEPEKTDLVSGFLVQFQILGHEEIYDELFVMAMDRGLDMDKLDDYFYDILLEGNIIPIGEGITIVRDGTGISPIKTGDDVRVIISFVTDEYKLRQEEAEAAKNDK